MCRQCSSNRRRSRCYASPCGFDYASFYDAPLRMTAKRLPARNGETLPARVILSEAELRSSAERARRDLGRDGCTHKGALHSADTVPFGRDMVAFATLGAICLLSQARYVRCADAICPSCAICCLGNAICPSGVEKKQKAQRFLPFFIYPRLSVFYAS